ncbi:MAG: mismatch repair protein MutS [Candidatus Dependentiae bacterium]|nr:mismatch repair protein MutS [Candidatus Dependentiae bacterium]
MKNFYWLLTLTYLTSTSLLVSIAPTTTPYDLLREEMLQNFPAIKLNQRITLNEKKEVAYPDVALSPYEQHESLFTLLNINREEATSEIIDATTINNLNLFFYNIKRPDYSILEKIYRGYSLNGKIAQARLMASPTDSIAILHKRQALISYLLRNQSLQDTLIPLFRELAALEERLYSLWNPDDILYTNYVKKTFYSGNFKKYSGSNGAFWLELNRRRKDFKPVTDFLIFDTINTLLRHFHMRYVRNIEDSSAQPGWVRACTAFQHTQYDTNDEAQAVRTEENTYAAASTILALIPTLLELDQWKRTIRSYTNLAQHIRTRTKVLVACKEIISKIYAAISDDLILSHMLDHYEAIKDFALGTNETQKHFLQTLSSPAFHGHSYHFSYIGKVLHAIPQFLELKSSFCSVFKGIGLLEAYLSIAALLHEKASSPTPWCFVNYALAPTPRLTITDYYHPLIPSETAVVNSIELGKDGEQGMIVTGPNASGKSMNIRSIALCILLGQSLGIAPARSALITPMSKILTYFNPVDNIAQGRSLFQVEEDRISYLVKTAYNLPPHKFSFIIVDELLSSTAPAEGEAAAFGICYGLSKLPNCMPIAATHFPRLTTLPRHTNGFFSNHHVSVIKKENGDIVHTFKLEYGRSHQVIALDLARQAGFDSDIVAHAEEFLARRGIKRDRIAL